MTVQVIINGQRRAVPADTSVGQVVAMITDLAAGVAAALNGEIVPRRSWAAALVQDGDRVEVVTAVQGG
ncbi:MAG TPA: sulfur carrier protein ThiS [Streptosporangiaceae bacterium]|nr:sulfur carrier protein ThiS [Streptosporangiaceae bacterium]